MKYPQDLTHSDSEVLQSRLSARLASVLSEQAAAVPHDISERLRVAREQALVRARTARHAQAATGAQAVSSGGGTLVLGGSPPWWLRLATILPLVVLLAGLVLIEEWNTHEQVLAAAEIDAVLLADDLPPDAWVDVGFREFLKSPPP